MTDAIIVILLIAIVASLGSAMVFLVKDHEGERTLRALTMRVALSVVLIIVLGIGLYTGWIHPHGQKAQPADANQTHSLQGTQSTPTSEGQPTSQQQPGS